MSDQLVRRHSISSNSRDSVADVMNGSGNRGDGGGCRSIWTVLNLWSTLGDSVSLGGVDCLGLLRSVEAVGRLGGDRGCVGNGAHGGVLDDSFGDLASWAVGD